MGLTLILGLIYTALEWKTFDDSECYCLDELSLVDDISEDVPITAHFMKPPPPPVSPTVIEIAPDDPEIIETGIETTDPNPDTKILEPTAINLEEVEEDITLIIDLIDEVPVFPGCEDASDKKACFQKMMTKHVNRNIRYPDLAMKLDIQGRVATQFIIGKDGAIENVNMRGPHQVLEKEAARIIAKLPKMEPGKHKGKNAKVVFSMPITFKMQ